MWKRVKRDDVLSPRGKKLGEGETRETRAKPRGLRATFLGVRIARWGKSHSRVSRQAEKQRGVEANVYTSRLKKGKDKKKETAPPSAGPSMKLYAHCSTNPTPSSSTSFPPLKILNVTPSGRTASAAAILA